MDQSGPRWDKHEELLDGWRERDRTGVGARDCVLPAGRESREHVPFPQEAA